MPRFRDVDRQLLARAHRGELTRANTAQGSEERRAVYRATYLRRRDARFGLTARQALGHAAPADVLPSISVMVDNPPRYLILEGLSRRDTRRAGRYEGLVAQLRQGRLTSATFRRRIASWKPIAGYTFLSDPDAVLAILDQLRAEDRETFHYESGRAT